MFLPYLARILAYVLSIGYLLFGSAWAAAPLVDRARETLPTRDGWGSVPVATLPQGTTGGSQAAATRTHIVTSRKELMAALSYPDPTPKLIHVKGSIDLNVDDENRPLSCESYRRADPATGEMFSLQAFLFMYDPAGALGQRMARDGQDPYGGQEDARVASAAAQASRIRIRVPPNTTIYGLGSDAQLIGAALDIGGPGKKGSAPMNVIVRNITFLDTHDCFPEWSPGDGPTGNWNSAYDSIAVHHATHVWIDHNRFADSRTRDELQPVYFGRHVQVHDGLVDITNESDFVTVSWNQFATHDKTMLIGNSDRATADREHLRVTVHHNLFDGTVQRMPRVRFGRVHVYNNVYRAGGGEFRSAWGAGVESRIFAEANYFHVGGSPSAVIDGKGATRITVAGNCWRTGDTCDAMQFQHADLATDAGWTPTLYGATGGPEAVDTAYRRVLDESGPERPRR